MSKLRKSLIHTAYSFLSFYRLPIVWISLCFPLSPLILLGLKGYKKREIIMTVKWGNPVSGIFYRFFSDALFPL